MICGQHLYNHSFFYLVAFLVLLMLLSFATDKVYASLYLKFNRPCVRL